MITKVAGGIVGLGAISIGSVAFAKPEWLGINREIPWTPLFRDKDFTESATKSNYSGKFGDTYKYYLVGTTENQDWWNKTFKQLKRDGQSSRPSQTPSDKFKDTDSNGSLKEGFSTKATDNSLNQICQKAYKVASSDITDDGKGDNKYKKADVWKYCSGLGEKPKTIAEVDTTNQQYKDQVSGKDPIGKDSGNRSKLISTIGNDKFWEIRDKEFKNKDNYGPIETDTSDAFFKVSENTTIRDLCEKAYSLDAVTGNSTAQKPTKEQTIKYCSLDKSAQ